MIRKAVHTDFPKICQYYREFDESGIDLFNSRPFSNMIVYELDSKIVGFINYSIIYDRAELDYIYVDESYRRKNIASELLQYCIDVAIKSGCRNITLEVNEHNKCGLSLYEKFKFKKAAMRPKYYHGEDAILMIRELKKSE